MFAQSILDMSVYNVILVFFFCLNIYKYIRYVQFGCVYIEIHNVSIWTGFGSSVRYQSLSVCTLYNLSLSTPAVYIIMLSDVSYLFIYLFGIIFSFI